MGAPTLRDDGPPVRVEEWQIERARRYVAAHSEGVEDARQILQALGLLGTEEA
jgi:hypothetical protein